MTLSKNWGEWHIILVGGRKSAAYKPTSAGASASRFLPSLQVAMDFHASPNTFPLNGEFLDNLNFLSVLETCVFTTPSFGLLLIKY